jgi:DNA-directed RNA polymerase subunit RPC12/RpoP
VEDCGGSVCTDKGGEWIGNYIVEQLAGSEYSNYEEIPPGEIEKLKCSNCGSLVYELYVYHEAPEYVGKVNLEDGAVDEANDIINTEYIVKCAKCGSR